MPAVNTHADGIKFYDVTSSEEVVSLAALNSLSGVEVSRVAGRNGAGKGCLRRVAGRLSWRAPGSSTFGPSEDPTDFASNTCILEDGADRNKYIEVVSRSDMPTQGAASAIVELYHARNNHIASADVTTNAGDADDVETFNVGLSNQTGMDLQNVRVWLDSTATGFDFIEISLAFPTSWVQPDSETHADVLSFDIPLSSSYAIQVRRTIPGGEDPQADVTNCIKVAWDGP